MTSTDENLFLYDHPIVQDRLATLRSKDTDSATFRTSLATILTIMFPQLTRDLEVIDREIETPITKTTGQKLKRSPVIVPILRAALGMSNIMEQLLPESATGHVGVYRNEETKEPVEYVVKLPPMADRDIYVVDPMLATGGSLLHTLKIICDNGADMSRIKFIGLIASPEGVEAIRRVFPRMEIHLAALDSHLNEKAYIVPGLGDAGDRLFGTL